MTAKGRKQKKEEYVKTVHERLGEIGKNPAENVAFQQELSISEVIEELEMERRWEVILGPLGVA